MQVDPATRSVEEAHRLDRRLLEEGVVQGLLEVGVEELRPQGDGQDQAHERHHRAQDPEADRQAHHAPCCGSTSRYPTPRTESMRARAPMRWSLVRR